MLPYKLPAHIPYLLFKQQAIVKTKVIATHHVCERSTEPYDLIAIYKYPIAV